ncbi:MAG: lipid-A-disaccharide synthase [Bacteroidota bacterium]|nr:lipid-A-disaccharide synthase [Bacteroidota bacterium]
MRVFWIAGEPSGDLQAASLVSALHQANPNIMQAGWGGSKMTAAGMQQKFDLPGQPFMGFVEVALRAKTIMKLSNQVKKDIVEFGTQVLILVDYAGFNLRIAKWAKGKGLRVVYFIPPKIWAWNESRLTSLMQHSDEVLSILPFEESWYASRGEQVHYVGNPLMEKYVGLNHYKSGSKKIVLLPGSRVQEISRLLPVFNSLAKELTQYSFYIVRAPSVRSRWPKKVLASNIIIEDREIVEVAKGAQYALTCSGTASLEIALLGIPQAVVYKANLISLAIAKRLVNVRFMSLPNLIMDKAMVPEFLQGQVTVENLKTLIESSPSEQLIDIERFRSYMGKRSLIKDAVPRILALFND